eukprot:TRINITY_DN7393_c0_g1_i2.p1 TRINITY_DN7393_c0_g1~~TRINITY_DN7393_c0_g1_i2.p1  ORF type:complete len:1438 (+),score=201.48 TRINITY_DN7393_c0_g1_i2:125-4438(+)
MQMVIHFLLLACTCSASQNDLHNTLTPHGAGKPDESLSHLRVEVDSQGPNVKKSTFSLLRSERFKHSSELLDSDRGASPEFGTTNATCDGTVISCTGEDPCSQAAADACTGLYHACGGGERKRCEVKDGKCKTGSECYDMCQGYYFDKKSNGAPGKPTCADLNTSHCQNGYVPDPDSTIGAGFQCQLKDTLACIVLKRCAIQNPPDVLGEKQCRAPEVENGHADSTCEGSKRVRPNFACKTQCRWGYTPDKATLDCKEDGKLVPESFNCKPNDCSAPTVVNGRPAGTCAEGAKVSSGSTCTALCKAGYSSNVESVACHAQVLSPATFLCQKDCAVPNVANALGGQICKEGANSVKAFTKCTLQCAEGYTPSTPEASCNAGKFFPETFSCVPNPCTAPTGIQFSALNGACKERNVNSGGKCTSSCQPGYSPSVAELSCTAGKLTPQVFTCNPDPCNAPQVANAPTPSCRNGAKPAHGSKCDTICKEGYTPSLPSLDCELGVFKPEIFRCVEQPCATPKVTNAKPSACREGDQIPAKGFCTVACAPGYEPAKARVQCLEGKLVETLRCNPKPCPAPPKTGNAQGCVEGDSILHAKSCTPKCSAGTATSPPNLRLECIAGTLTPPSFICGEDPCPAPANIANVDPAGACAGGKTMIESDANCIPKCKSGYEPNVDKLSCKRGALTPASFTCGGIACQVPTTGGRSCKGKAAGATLAHGDKCETVCAAATDKPNVAMVECREGILQSFSCGKKGCDPPAVANGGCAEADIPSGGSCTVSCKTNYVASIEKLSCSGGTFTPASFDCEQYCTPPDHITCAQGALILSRQSCTVSCKNGGNPSVATLSCTKGNMPSVECTVPPPVLARTRSGTWGGDPHFRNAGPASDPLRPGVQWAIKMECPTAKNWMWLQVLQGPEVPSGSMGFAVSGSFIDGHVLKTYVTGSGFATSYDGSGVNPGWSTTVNGVRLSVGGGGNSISINAGDWVSYTGYRSSWGRPNYNIDGVVYSNAYESSNSLTWGICKGGKTRGVVVEGYSYGTSAGIPAVADRVPPDSANMFKSSKTTVANYLQQLGNTPVRSRCFKKSGSTYTEIGENEGGGDWERGCPPCQRASDCAQEPGLLMEQEDAKTDTRSDNERRAAAEAEAQELELSNLRNVHRLDTLLAESQAQFDCSAAAMAMAKAQCATVENGAIDHEDKMKHDAIYVACVFDICVTKDTNLAGDAIAATEREQQDSILDHKFKFLACDACPGGMLETGQTDADLSSEEKQRLAAAAANAAYNGKKFCRSNRAYVVVPSVFHNGTRWQNSNLRGACANNRLARPRTEAARTAAKAVLDKYDATHKAWLGGKGDNEGWKWYDWNNGQVADIAIDASINVGGSAIDPTEGAHNFLCMERATGKIIKCDLDAMSAADPDAGDADQIALSALCETVFYEPDIAAQTADACR